MSRKTDSLKIVPHSMIPDLDSIIAERMRQMAARADVSSALSGHATLGEKFVLCTEALVQHLDAAAARLWLVTSDWRTLALKANSGANTTPVNHGPHIPVASPALRHIVERREPYISDDVRVDPHLRHLHWPSGERMAYAGLPLISDKRAIGVLAMFSRGRIGSASLETLRVIADKIADAIQRAPDDPLPRRAEGPATETQRLSSLLGAVRHAIDRSEVAPSREAEMQVLRDRYSLLSRREREVMALVADGNLNKQVGDRLGISEITVKAHRGHMMRKLEAYSLPDLVKIAVLLEILPST